MKPKRELLRIVRTADGTVRVDPTGKMAGRGAYICTDRACFEETRKLKRLAKALACPVNEQVYEQILERLGSELGQ